MSRQYYISSGNDNKMFTLRVRYFEKINGPNGAKLNDIDKYICNLATDEARARTKAITITNVVPYNDGSLDPFIYPSLDEIKRREIDDSQGSLFPVSDTPTRPGTPTKEQSKACIRDEYFPFKKYKLKSFDYVWSIDRSYVYRWISKSPVGVVEKALIDALKVKFKDYLLPEPNGDYFGEKGSRHKGVSATVLSIFSKNTRYGMFYIDSLVLDSGELVCYKGGKPVQWNVGEMVVMDFAIKDHEEFRGKKQTVINRVNMTGIKKPEVV